MTLLEIKQAVDSGKTVHWINTGYKVIKLNGFYYMECPFGISHTLDTSKQELNGKEHDFFMVSGN